MSASVCAHALERSRVARLLVCATTGLAFGLAAPPHSAAWLDWLALIPVLWVVRMRISLPESLLLGGVSGLGVGLVGFSWIGQTLVNFAGFPDWLGTLGLGLYAAWMSVPYALFGLAIAAGPRDGPLGWAWSVTAFVGLTHSWPLVFPYTPLIGLTQTPAWIQLAELGGVAAVEVSVVSAAWLAVRALEQPDLGGQWKRATAALSLPVVAYAGGELRMAQIEDADPNAPRTVVGVVQPNTPPLFGDAEASLERLREGSARAQAEGAQWIVWPEAGPYPYALERPVRSEPAPERARVLVRHRTPTLFGAVTYGADDPRPYNTLVHLAPDGTVPTTYDKVELVPFGESIPLVDPTWLLERIPAISQLNRGAGPARFEIDLEDGPSFGAGPLICYEDIIPEFARLVAAQPGGIEVFVNATIDGWYGPSEPWEHLALAQLRSVEHRIPMVRAVSTGVSSVIGATGRRLAEIPVRPADPMGAAPAPAEILVHELILARNTASQPTLFARGGWLLTPLLRLLVGLAVFAAIARWIRVRIATKGHRRRSRESVPQPLEDTSNRPDLDLER